MSDSVKAKGRSCTVNVSYRDENSVLLSPQSIWIRKKSYRDQFLALRIRG